MEIRRLINNSPYRNFHLFEDKLTELTQLSVPDAEPEKQEALVSKEPEPEESPSPEQPPSEHESLIEDKTPTNDEEKPGEVIEQNHSEVQQHLIAEARDAHIEIEISADHMQATAHYKPAKGGDNLNREKIISLLKKNKVYKGITQKGLSKLLENPPESMSLLIASGQEPELGTPTTFEQLATTIQQRQLVPQMRDDGTLDMRELGEISTVVENQPLMRKINSQAGANGYTISGEVIYSQTPSDLPLIPGEGTKINPDDPCLLIATRSGVPVEIDNGIKVDDILMIDQNIDLSIGNIDYEGSVLVQGDVKEGMIVKACGDIVIKGFVEGARIESQSNISIGEGILGSRKEIDNEEPCKDDFNTSIIAEGTITARYAQHAYLQANSIQLGSQLLHCMVKSETSIQVGKEGQRAAKLVGGYLFAQEHIAAGVIGAPSLTKTVLDFSRPFHNLTVKIKSASDQQQEKIQLLASIDKVKKRLQPLPDSPEKKQQLKKVSNTEAACKKDLLILDREVEKLKDERKRLKRTISVRVFDKLFPGIEIRLAEESDIVSEEHRAGTFRFEEDRLVFDR
jgi:hypothetical protein